MSAGSQTACPGAETCPPLMRLRPAARRSRGREAAVLTKCRPLAAGSCYYRAEIGKDVDMIFKFSVGQAVEFTPRGGKLGLFTIVRHMPEELQSADPQYRVQSEQGIVWSAAE